jgi:hypothetical protein
VDGYEYLQGLSTQMPEMFLETASNHRRTLQDAIHLLSEDDKAAIAAQEQVMYFIGQLVVHIVSCIVA